MPANKSGKAGLARRYATALFELAKEQGTLDSVASDIAVFEAMIEESKDLATAIKSPVLSASEVAGAVKTLLTQAKAQEVTIRTIEVMAQNRRLQLVGEVLKEFHKMLSAERGEVEVEVTSAVALGKAHKESLETAFKTALGRKVIFKERVNEEILGGLKVKVGSELIDASVEGRLERLTRIQKTASLKG